MIERPGATTSGWRYSLPPELHGAIQSWRTGRVVHLVGADGEHVRRHGRAVDAAVEVAAVAGGGDDDDAGVPRPLDGGRERITLVGLDAVDRRATG